MKNLHEFLREFDFCNRPNVQVQRMVVNRLKTLIPSDTAVQDEKLSVIGFALLTLCKPNSLDEVDWPAVITLASDICNLQQRGWLM